MSDSIDPGSLQASDFGPLQPLIEDDEIVEILVAGYRKVSVQRRTGEREDVDVSFRDDIALDEVIETITAPLIAAGESRMIRQGRISSSLQVTAALRPVATGGSALNIRKLSAKRLTRQEILDSGAVTTHALEFLRACVIAGFNIIFSGGRSSGKTTMLNELASFIPDDQRIVTIQQELELQLAQPDVIHLTPKSGDSQGEGEATMRDLVWAAQGLSADRILIDELRAGEIFDFVQGMNLGIRGAIATIRGPDVRETLHRLELRMRMAEPTLRDRVIQEVIASGIHLIVQLQHRDGFRRVVQITEARGLRDDGYELADIFQFVRKPELQDGKIVGDLEWTGIRPKYHTMIEEAGIALPPHRFSSPPRPE